MFIDVGGLITSEVFIHACGEVTISRITLHGAADITQKLYS